MRATKTTSAAVHNHMSGAAYKSLHCIVSRRPSDFVSFPAHCVRYKAATSILKVFQ